MASEAIGVGKTAISCRSRLTLPADPASIAFSSSPKDLSVYETLLKELQDTGCDSLFISWHGDSHIIADVCVAADEATDMTGSALPFSVLTRHPHSALGRSGAG